jgi:hypothetical protein
VHNRIISTVRRVEFVSDRMSYIILSGHWCNIIIVLGCPNKNAGFNKVKKLFYFHEIAYIFTSLQRVHVPI